MQRMIVLLLAIVVFPPATALSQARKRTTTTKAPSRTGASQRAAEVQREGAVRVGNQIKTLTRFIYLLGGVAKGLEAMDDAVKRNQASPAVVEQARSNKATVRTSIQKLREELDKLEIDFRATPELQRFYHFTGPVLRLATPPTTTGGSTTGGYLFWDRIPASR